MRCSRGECGWDAGTREVTARRQLGLADGSLPRDHLPTGRQEADPTLRRDPDTTTGDRGVLPVLVLQQASQTRPACLSVLDRTGRRFSEIVPTLHFQRLAPDRATRLATRLTNTSCGWVYEFTRSSQLQPRLRRNP